MGINWDETIGVIEETAKCMDDGNYSQPVKPYLRFGEAKNRIIAMPAFVGGENATAGIKWIASFPDNINKNIPRAHSVMVLNNINTGEPISIINTPLLSIIRTASVSGLIIKYYRRSRNIDKINLGIIGFGPIGKYHLKMSKQILEDHLNLVQLYDIRNIYLEDFNEEIKSKIVLAENWEKVYDKSDIFITCTVAKERYINKKPQKGSLQLNVSLRDYTTEIYSYVKDTIIVDDWEEVCRENTDIEKMYQEKGLKREQTHTIVDVICNDLINTFKKDKPIMFNPMGMGIFDVALAKYYYDKAIKNNIGRFIE